MCWSCNCFALRRDGLCAALSIVASFFSLVTKLAVLVKNKKSELHSVSVKAEIQGKVMYLINQLES